MVHISPPRLTVNTIVQGVPFHAGFHPRNAAIADSPLQAYDDNISDSGSDMMIQRLVIPLDSFYQANESMLARSSLVKSAVSYLLLPNVHMDNSFFMNASYTFSVADMYELLGEAMISARRKSKSIKLSFLQESAVGFDDRTESEDIASSDKILIMAGQKRKKMSAKGALQVPECTTQVRRSSRCNKYNGFKPKNISDTKIAKSKVKPRKIPSVPVPVTTDIILQEEAEFQGNNDQIPPVTPVPVLQAIGINLCGVPPEELSPKELMASLQAEKMEEEDTVSKLGLYLLFI
jgi:hypothetical protein